MSPGQEMSASKITKTLIVLGFEGERENGRHPGYLSVSVFERNKEKRSVDGISFEIC